MPTTSPRKPGATDIATLLRREIINGSLDQHDRLPAERVLAESYGVSRGTVRAAIRKLAKQELVEVRAGSGTYVSHDRAVTAGSPIEHALPLELMDARFALEPHVCRLAVLHSRRADFDKLEDLLGVMENSIDDPAKFAEADAEFHAALVQSTGNNLLIWIIAKINSVRGQDEWTRMRHLTLERKIIARYNSQHRQIVKAIRAREPERAANLMKEHLETARLSLTRAAET